MTGVANNETGRLPRRLSGTVIARSIIIIAALAVYYRLSWPTFHDFVRAVDYCGIPFCDFVVFYYQMGREVFITKAPVVGFGYSPFVAVIFGSFGMFSLDVSTILWVLLLFGCMVGLGIVSLILIPPASRRRFFLPFLAVFLTSFPILHNFKWGQVGVLLTLLLISALLTNRGRRWMMTSLCLALAASLKYFPILFVLPFLFRKDWKVVGGFVGWCIILFIGIPSVFFGVAPTMSFLGQISHTTLRTQIAAGGPNSQFFANVVMRWLPEALAQPALMKSVLRVIGFFIVELILILIFFVMTRRVEKSFEWSFVLAFLSVPFFVATSWPHYLVFLPFCQLYLASEIYGRKELGLLARTVTGGMTLASVLLSNVLLFQLMGRWEAYTGSGFLFLADLLLLIASFVFLLPRIRILRPRDDLSVPVPTSV